MARRLGEQLAAAGLPKARLTNQKPFQQIVTEIQYRNGYADVNRQRNRNGQQNSCRLANRHSNSDTRAVRR